MIKFPPLNSNLPPLSVRTMSNTTFDFPQEMSISPTSMTELNETIPMQLEETEYIEPRTLNSYEIIKTLGQGSQGRVDLVKIKSTGQIVALKVVYIKDQEILNTVNKEIQALEEASFPNCNLFVSCYYNHFYDAFNKSMLIEMEYIEGADLDVWAKRFRDRKSFIALYQNLIYLTIDLCKGLSYLHGKGLIHRDLKPANILITVNNEPKIVDLGVSCLISSCPSSAYNCCYGRAGTPIFLAPETISKSETYFSSDIWCLGGTLFRAATGQYAFEVNDANNVQAVMRTVLDTMPYLLQTSNLRLNQLVNSMLTKVPENRPTIPDILAFLL